MPELNVSRRLRALASGAIACAVLAACQTSPSSSGAGASTPSVTGSASIGGAGVTASDPKLATHSGFLSDYARLASVPGSDGARCWRETGVDWKKYDSLMIARMAVTLKPGQLNHVDPTDLKALLDYFHGALVKTLQPELKIVDKAGPGVIVLRIALTDLAPTNVAASLAGTAIPYGYVLDVGSGVATGLPAGATPYLGETGIEVQLRDGATNAALAECADTEVGRKYVADLNAGAAGAAQAWVGGYLNSFTTWSYAKDAFDKWATLTARRIAALKAS